MEMSKLGFNKKAIYGACLYAANKIVSNIELEENSCEWLSSSCEFSSFFQVVFEVSVFSKTMNCRLLVESLFEKVLVHSSLAFLCNIWTNEG